MNIGVLGGGQLGQMLALAGIPLGFRFVFLDPKPGAPASAAGEQLVGAFDDPALLDALVERTTHVTCEFENVPPEALRHVARHRPALPGPEALATVQDRLTEKELFSRLAIPTAPFRAASGPAELASAVGEIGAPAVAKTRRLGYDGKGQATLSGEGDAERVWAELGETPLLVERLVDFERELSVLAVRGRDGTTACYPLTANDHRAGILRVSRAPYRDDALQSRAEGYARRLLGELDYVGVLAIELFLTGGELVANEIAPRVHNSGHWTIEGAVTSQFENHLRAISGLALGETSAVGEAAMVNHIGREPALAELAAVPGAHIHSYGKDPRPGRKLGHATVTAAGPETLDARLEQVLGLIEPDG